MTTEGKGEKPLESYIQSLADEGGQESDGAFSINPEKARAKLAEFALEEPHHYTGVLVSALVKAGATYIDIETDSDDFILKSDVFLTRTELEQLFSLASDGDSHFFRLAMGLQASLTTEPQLVEMECWNGTEGANLKLSEEKIETAILNKPEWPDQRTLSRIHVRYKPSLKVAARFLKKMIQKAATPEQQFLEEHFCFAPLPLKLNNKPVNKPPNLTDCLACIQVGPDLPAELSPKGKIVARLSAEGFTAFLGYRVDQLGHSSPHLIMNGMTVDGWKLDVADETIIYCDTLTTDLTFTKLVSNAALKSLEEKLVSSLQAVLPELMEGALAETNRFPTRDGDRTYAELMEFYQRDGFLTVVGPDYAGANYGGAPLVLLGARFLDALFPNQVADEKISDLVPPGKYRARIPSEKGPELALKWEPQPTMDSAFPRRIVHAGPQPKIKDVVKLYEAADDLEQISLDEGLELLHYLVTNHTPYARSLKDLMNDPNGPFELSPDSYLSRLVAALKLPTLDGEGVDLGTLAHGLHDGPCRIVFTDHPLRFEPPPPSTVLVPTETWEALQNVVGFTNLRTARDIRTGIIDKNGAFVNEPEVVNLGDQIHCGRLRYQQGELWGFTDENGVPVIEAQYEEVMDFQDGTTVVSTGKDDFRIIDTDGKILTDRYNRIFKLNDGLRLAWRRDKWGYLDREGKVVIPIEFEAAGHFGEGEALITDGDKRFFIDHKGQFVRNCPVESDVLGPLRHGLRLCKRGELFGFLDREANWAVEPRYKICWSPNGEVIPVQNMSGMWALIDYKGEKVTPFEYSWMETEFGEGLIAVRKDERSCSYIDSEGRTVISGFESGGTFSDGLAPVQRDRWGYIDRRGDFIIPPNFLQAQPFREGRAVVRPYNF